MSLLDRKNDFYGVNPPTALWQRLSRDFIERLLGVETEHQLAAGVL